MVGLGLGHAFALMLPLGQGLLMDIELHGRQGLEKRIDHLQRLCQMAKSPPTGGDWRAWYARLCKLINQYYERSDNTGRFARRLLREMNSLWVFLAHQGIEPTNNRGERALRFGVQWRKRSLGTASDKGNRWVERILSLKETCRLCAVSTYEVLVDAVSSFFRGQQPDLACLQEN